MFDVLSFDFLRHQSTGENMHDFGLFVEYMNDKGNLLSMPGYIINHKFIVVVINLPFVKYVLCTGHFAECFIYLMYCNSFNMNCNA